MNRRRTLAALMAAGILLLSACGGSDEELTDLTPDGVAVETVTVTRGEIYNESQLSGQIVANREVSVIAPLPVKVLSVNVKVGDSVTQDQVLYSLDKTDIQKNYQPLLDNYNRTQTLMSETIRLAQENADNTRALYEIGAASKTQLDQAEFSLLQQQITAETQLSQLEESMRDVNDTLNDTNVKAPITGVVTSVNVVENATASQQVASVVIAETQVPQVSVSVSESLIPSINVGDMVTVTVPAVSEYPFAAPIQSIAPAASAQTRLYEVKVDLPSDTDYQVGMFANVTFQLNHHSDVVTIPSEAILTDGIEEYVYIITGDGNTAAKIVITTGITNGTYTEVTEGLGGTEKLVVKGQNYLAEGALVRIVAED